MSESIRLDHLVLTVSDVDASSRWYAEILGLEPVRFSGGRHALRVGDQKINLHPLHTKISPRAASPTTGSADLCFVTQTDLDFVSARLESAGVVIVEGPVERTGARATLRSVYVRDPDGNLIEIANEVQS